MPRVRIEPWKDSDLDLLRRRNAPEMTEHLGGPATEEQAAERHHRYLAKRESAADRMHPAAPRA